MARRRQGRIGLRTRRRSGTAAVVLGLVLLAGLVVPPPAAAAGEVADVHRPKATDALVTVPVAPGDDLGPITEANPRMPMVSRDLGLSAALPDGRRLWVFGDTLARNGTSYVGNTAALSEPGSTVMHSFTDASGRPVPFIPTRPGEDPATNLWAVGLISAGSSVLVFYERSGPTEAHGASIGVARFEYHPERGLDAPLSVVARVDDVFRDGDGYRNSFFDGRDGYVYGFECRPTACTTTRAPFWQVADRDAWRFLSDGSWAPRGAAPATPMVADDPEATATGQQIPDPADPLHARLDWNRLPWSGGSVGWSERLGRFVWAYGAWPGYTNRAQVRLSVGPTGPWTPPTEVDLPGCSGPGALCYAVSYHPDFDTDGRLGLSYHHIPEWDLTGDGRIDAADSAELFNGRNHVVRAAVPVPGPPGAPRQLDADLDGDRVVVRWAPPPAGAAATWWYEVTLVDESEGAGPPRTVPVARHATEVVLPVAAGSRHHAEVRAANPSGRSAPARSASVPLDVPSPPTGVRARPDDGYAEVWWDLPPPSERVDRWVVTAMAGGRPPVVAEVTGGVPHLDVGGLADGVVHELTVQAVNAAGTSGPSAPAPVTPAAGGSRLRLLPEPRRVLDTRDGTGGRTTPLGPGEVATFALAGPGVPAPGTYVSAVLTVTAVGPTAASHVVVWAGDRPQPATSNLNVAAGEPAVANLVTTQVASDGTVRLFNNEGSVHLVADLVATYALPLPGPGDPSAPGAAVPTAGHPGPRPGRSAGHDRPAGLASGVGPRPDLAAGAGNGRAAPVGDDQEPGTGSLVRSITPVRALDTQFGPGARGRPAGAMVEPGEVLTLDLAGLGGPGGLPGVGDLAGVLLNVTAAGATAPGHVQVWAEGDPEPATSVANPRPGAERAVAVVARTGPNGAVHIANHGGRVRLVVDVVGVITPAGATTGGATYHPLAPVRRLDTRADAGATPLPAMVPVPVDLRPFGAGVGPEASAVDANVVALGGAHAAWVGLWPGGLGWPGTSSVNVGPGEAVANRAFTGIDAAGRVNLMANVAGVHTVVDVTGWWGPPT